MKAVWKFYAVAALCVAAYVAGHISVQAPEWHGPAQANIRNGMILVCTSGDGDHPAMVQNVTVWGETDYYHAAILFASADAPICRLARFTPETMALSSMFAPMIGEALTETKSD